MSDYGALVPVIVGGVLSGGIASAIVSGIKARGELRQSGEKLPAEKSSVIAEGAEKAVVSLTKALDEAESRISELRRELQEEKDLSALKDRTIGRLQSQLDDVEDVVLSLRGQCEHLERVIAAIRQNSESQGWIIPPEMS